MDKIKRKSDALDLAKLFIAGASNISRWYCPGYDEEKPVIQIWDEVDSNRLMIFIEEGDYYQNGSRPYLVAYTDTVNDTEYFRRCSLDDIQDDIWKNRKYINNSGQLAQL